MPQHYKPIPLNSNFTTLAAALCRVNAREVESVILVVTTGDSFRVRSTQCCAGHTIQRLANVGMSIGDALERQDAEDKTQEEASTK